MALNPALSSLASKAVGALSSSQTYAPIAENWYQSLPYAFIATLANGSKKIFYMPLNPSNIQITTQFATNIIATIGGTVEEHAPQRYFDISIAGTTGIAPKHVNAIDGGGLAAKVFSKIAAAAGQTSATGRQAYTPEASIGQFTGGFFAKTTGALDNALNAARDILAGARKQESGFSAANSGYMAFHNFYRFLLEGKAALASGSSGGGIAGAASALGAFSAGAGSLAGAVGGSKAAPLKFISYKDNQEYTCAILKFELSRSAENPMLYNYSILLRAYGLKSVGDKPPAANDRLASLGLGGGESILSSIKGKVGAAKRGISAIGGLRRGAGG
jgi:hypothetical protein